MPLETAPEIGALVVVLPPFAGAYPGTHAVAAVDTVEAGGGPEPVVYLDGVEGGFALRWLEAAG